MKKHQYKNIELAKRLKCDEKEVRRLLNPRYKSKLPRIEQALKVLGERVTLSVVADKPINDDLPPKLPPKQHQPHFPRSAAG